LLLSFYFACTVNHEWMKSFLFAVLWRMKCFLFIIAFLLSIRFYGQENNGNGIIGEYYFNKQEIKGARAYYTVIIRIKRNKTFEYKASSHLMGQLEDNGTWATSNDTLILTKKDKSLKKYLISKNRICSILIESNEKIMCLKKTPKKKSKQQLED
jgi:hypothetical protein